MKLEKMLITKLPGLFFTFGKNHLCNKTISDETYLKIECFSQKADLKRQGLDGQKHTLNETKSVKMLQF